MKRSRISWLECLIAKMRTVLGDAEIANPHGKAKALKLYCKQPDDNEAQWVSVASELTSGNSIPPPSRSR